MEKCIIFPLEQDYFVRQFLRHAQEAKQEEKSSKEDICQPKKIPMIRPL